MQLSCNNLCITSLIVQDLNQYQQFNIKKPLNTNFETVLFCFWQTFFGFVIPLFSGLILWIFFNNSFAADGFLSKLILHLSLVTFFGGFWILWILFWAMWDEAYIELMFVKSDLIPSNGYFTLEIIIPEGFDYDTQNVISFMFYIKNAFRSNDITLNNMLQFGKFDTTLTFDFVIKDKKLKIYTTIARKKYTQLIEGMIRLFPGLIINLVDDPYKGWPAEWKEGSMVGSNTEFAGYAFGLRADGFHPFYKLSNIPKKANWSSLDNFLRNAKDSIRNNEIVVMQYVFMASKYGLPNEEYQTNYNQWRQKLYNRYTPKRSGKKEGEAFGALLPQKEILKNQAYYYRATQVLLQTSIKVGAFCTTDRLNYIENLIEKLGDIYSGDNSRVGRQRPEKKHIIATNQKYFRHQNKVPEFEYIYDRFIYPSKNANTVGDQFFGPFYEKYFYPNENRWRKKANYKSMIYREIASPWNGYEFYVDPIAGAGIFQFPVSAYNPNSYYPPAIPDPAENFMDRIYDREEGD